MRSGIPKLNCYTSNLRSKISDLRFQIPLWAVMLSVCLGAANDNGDTDLGPDVVILDQLVEHYQPVPFDHKGHARMAEMWDGCVTCHHHTPAPEPAAQVNGKMQDLAAAIPACKSCHPIARNGEDLHMPNLKGAYHRQCLGCHREWSGANQCQACHEPLDPKNPPRDLTPAGILSRMHPPVPEPEDKVYRTRFTPAVGQNVLFRHKEHTEQHDLKCSSCHVRENCSSCHTATEVTTRPQPMQRGRTWGDTHKPCTNCHEADRCRSCHYTDEQSGPMPRGVDGSADPEPGPLRLIRASERRRTSDQEGGGL
jgi:hypothetical protein